MFYLLSFSHILAQGMFLFSVFMARDKLVRQRTSTVGTDCHPIPVATLSICEYFYAKISILKCFYYYEYF